MDLQGLWLELRQAAGLEPDAMASAAGLATTDYLRRERHGPPPDSGELLAVAAATGLAVVLGPLGYYLDAPDRLALPAETSGLPHYRVGDMEHWRWKLREPRERIDLTAQWWAVADGLVLMPDGAMAPMIAAGDWVGFAEQFPQPGEVVVLETAGQLFVRFLADHDEASGILTLVALDLHYLPLTLAATECVVFGPVVGIAALRRLPLLAVG